MADSPRTSGERWGRPLLGRAGVEVVDVGSLSDALEQRGPFDALLVDHELPDGTGAELLARWPLPTPFLAISGHDATQLARVWPEAERSVLKPFREDAILDAVEALLRS